MTPVYGKGNKNLICIKHFCLKLKEKKKKPRSPKQHVENYCEWEQRTGILTQQAGNVLTDRAFRGRQRFLEIPTHDSHSHLEPFVQAGGGRGGRYNHRRQAGRRRLRTRVQSWAPSRPALQKSVLPPASLCSPTPGCAGPRPGVTSLEVHLCRLLLNTVTIHRR